MAWVAFVRYCIDEGLPNPADLGTQPRTAEGTLIKYIQHLYDSKGQFMRAKYAVLAMQNIHRELKGQLRSAWDSVESWQQEREAHLRRPMPKVVLQALAGTARMIAWDSRLDNPGHAREYILFALCLEVGFHALLRPGELLAVRWQEICCDVVLDGEQGWASLAILRPKNRRYMGKVQYAAVRDQLASLWLASMHVSPDLRLWPYGRPRFSKRLTELLDILDLAECGFTMGSLRAGGATNLFRQGMDPSRLKYVGRWRSEFSCAHYLQEASATYILGQLAVHVRKRLASVAAHTSILQSPASWGSWAHGDFLFGVSVAQVDHQRTVEGKAVRQPLQR